LLAKPVCIKPITTAEYPTPAKRPSYSVLDKSTTWRALDHVAPHWRVSLRKMLQEVANV
jgi:dTDP-4-dehydrorhamnose reductase